MGTPNVRNGIPTIASPARSSRARDLAKKSGMRSRDIQKSARGFGNKEITIAAATRILTPRAAREVASQQLAAIAANIAVKTENRTGSALPTSGILARK